jgi:hypothetical protein
MQHICVCPSSETRRKRDHSEGEKKEGEHYGVSPFSGDDVDCVQVLSVSRRCERARPRMREIFLCVWEGQPKDPEGPRDFQYASWCVFSWQRRWLGVCVPTALDLCSLKCGTSRMGTTRKWQTCWCKNSVDYYTTTFVLYKVSYGFKGTKAKLTHLHDIIFSMKPS